jgi:hypothetical protein
MKYTPHKILSDALLFHQKQSGENTHVKPGDRLELDPPLFGCA